MKLFRRHPAPYEPDFTHWSANIHAKDATKIEGIQIGCHEDFQTFALHIGSLSVLFGADDGQTRREARRTARRLHEATGELLKAVEKSS